MKKILSAVIVFCMMIFSANCSAKDVYLGKTLEGTYWAISESLEHYDGYDYCEIDFKVVHNDKKYKIYHCQMWSSGYYLIDNETVKKYSKYPHPMYNLYRYTVDRINSGDYKDLGEGF